MTSTNAWRVLSSGESDGVVLACDFPTPARPEASLTEFVTHLTPAPTLWESAMPRAGAEAGWRAEDYLEWWLAPVRESGVRVSGVLGFCAGSVFASAVAAAVGDVPLVVIDPELPTSVALYAQYHRGVEVFGAALPKSDVDEMLAEGQQLLTRDDDVQVYGPALSELYLRVGDIALAKIGLNPARRAELGATFTSFVSWVVAAGQLDPTEQWARAVCVSSNDHAAQPIDVRERITVDVDHNGMLRHPEVARAVVEALAVRH
ncbi:hypothetical protein [Kutzneria sp. NPDC052558]|uniref:hypothetical protein n=1 Tax=Kutzneria sp. NPDC052558 TaxID=3364121 RepID=UPI0037C87E20